MTHTYHITGMTCSACVYSVKSKLELVMNVEQVEVFLEKQTAEIQSTRKLTTADLQAALGGAQSKYQISENAIQSAEKETSFLETYKPILLIFFYITGSSLLIEFSSDAFDFMRWMRHFMATFFLVFSFFKMLNIRAFADSYAMYDIIAKRLPSWGYIYVFLELTLGILFITDFQPYWTNLITCIVMSISIIGVIQSVLNKQKIQCACLGTVFNLPMSTITIIEDAIMIAMSGWMLYGMS
ncbi:MAG: heavy metal translocating P-type ATPase [Bacteroidetes bacterium]|nr:heavy metal translocating P-type ATPase [Bacteroidota bacterium]